MEMFFESKLKSGGGDLAEDVPIEYLGPGRAVVTFEDEAGNMYIMLVCNYISLNKVYHMPPLIRTAE